MSIDIARLDRALNAFGIEVERLFRKGTYVQAGRFLHMRLAVELSSSGSPVTPDLREVYENLGYLNQDLCDIETLLERIEWTRTL